MTEDTRDHIWTESYKINSFLVNLRGRAGLYTMLNLIQDVGWQHSIFLKTQLPQSQGWIFTRQKLVMNEWPRWNEILTIRTWLRPPSNGVFLFRDYEIFIGEGATARKVGQCTSTFTLMDLQTRKLAHIDWSTYKPIWTNEGYLTLQPGKILPQVEVRELLRFEVRNSDIDLNQHVNNTKYAQWVLDSIPMEVLTEGPLLTGYEVNFLAETKLGDSVQIQVGQNDRVDGDDAVVHFQGSKLSGAKPVFTAELRTKPRPQTSL